MRNSGSRQRIASIHNLGWALATLLVVGGAHPVLAQDDVAPTAEDPVWVKNNWKYEAAKACTPCHLQPSGNYKTDLSLLIEYPIWKSHDKHAQAYAVLEGDRGKKIGEAMKMSVLDEKTGCLNCHAMQLANKRGGGVDLKDGVSCGGCHGPSSRWGGIHYKDAVTEKVSENGPEVTKSWKDLTHEEKHFLGLRDLRDPKVRSTLCLSCHVGNAGEGKVVTHAMFVAGHPPLPPIELATFARNEPQHWRNARDVPYFKDADTKKTENYHLQDVKYQQTKLALVGSVVAFRETMRLAHDRATLKSKDPGALWPELLQGMNALTPDQAKALGAEELRGKLTSRWPDLALAHSDCYACHHDLRVPGFRQARGYGYQMSSHHVNPAIPGRPLVRIWPTAMLEAAIMHAGKPQRLEELKNKLDALTAVCNSRPFGQPDKLAEVTKDIITWCDAVVAEVDAVPCTDESVKKLLGNLMTLYVGKGTEPAKIPDFESARQIASVVRVAADELRINGKAPDFTAELKALSDQLDLDPFQKRPERIEITLNILSTPGNETELNDRKAFVHLLDMLRNLPDKEAEFKKDLETLRTKPNTFLTHVNVVENDTFNKGFQEKANILQNFGDIEQNLIYKAVDDYDPALFRKNMRTLIDKVTQ